jgi:hypothetical protein
MSSESGPISSATQSGHPASNLRSWSLEGPWSRPIFTWYWIGLLTAFLVGTLLGRPTGTQDEVFNPFSLWILTFAVMAGLYASRTPAQNICSWSLYDIAKVIVKDTGVITFCMMSLVVIGFLMTLSSAPYRGGEAGGDRALAAAFDQFDATIRWLVGVVLFVVIAYSTLWIVARYRPSAQQTASLGSSVPLEGAEVGDAEMGVPLRRTRRIGILLWRVTVAFTLSAILVYGWSGVQSHYPNTTIPYQKPPYIVDVQEIRNGTGRVVSPGDRVRTSIMGRYQDGELFARGPLTYEPPVTPSEGDDRFILFAVSNLQPRGTRRLVINAAFPDLVRFRSGDPDWYKFYSFGSVTIPDETYRFRTDRGNIELEITVLEVCRPYDWVWTGNEFVGEFTFSIGCW